MTNPLFEDESRLPPTTVPKDVTVCLRDFLLGEDAERFGESFARHVASISRFIDLSRLDGITVAYNYDDAIANLDRGFQPTKPPGRTFDSDNIGIATALPVLRSGVVKAHLIFLAPIVLPLEDPAGEGYRRALNIVAHECGHIEDLKNRDECFPGTILPHTTSDPEEAILERFALPLWQEYAACHASARFDEAQAATYEECLLNTLSNARERCNAAILAYRTHADIHRVIEEAGPPLCSPLKLAAYLIGHLDGLTAGLDSVPGVRDMLSGGGPYGPFVNRMQEVLRCLWLNRGQWCSPLEFKPLRDIIRDLFADVGIILQRLPNGEIYVNIPYRPETMP